MSATLRTLSLAVLTLVLAACGGDTNGSNLGAAGLTYTDPPSGGFRLVRDPGSTAKHLVLDLVGPDGAHLRGTAIALAATGPVVFTKVATVDAELVENGQFDLSGGAAILRGVSKDPASVQGGVFQRPSIPVLDATGGKVLLKLALDPTGATGSAALTVTRAIQLPETGPAQPITVAVGTLAVSR